MKSGHTPLIKINELCQKFNLPNLLVKDESKNPFGTWKDRRSELIIEEANKDSVNKICLITAGNAGYSLAKFAEGTGIKIVCIVDKNLSESIKQALKKYCHKVIEINLSDTMLESVEVVRLARENSQEIIYEATSCYPEAYESIIKEIKDKKPDYIICPIATGEAFIGLSLGLEKTDLKTKLIGVMPIEKHSFADKLGNDWILQNHFPMNKDFQIIKLTEEEIKSTYEFVKDYINCEPSSAVVFGALLKIHLDQNNKIILINSGKGLF